MSYLAEHNLLDPLFFFKLDGSDAKVTGTFTNSNPPIQEVSTSATFDNSSINLPLVGGIADEIRSTLVLWVRPKSASFNPIFLFKQDDDNYTKCYITIANRLHYVQVIEGEERFHYSFCLTDRTFCDNRWHTIIITTNALQLDFYIDSKLEKSYVKNNPMFYHYDYIEEVSIGAFDGKFYLGEMALFSFLPSYLESPEVNELEKYKYFRGMPETTYSFYYGSAPYRYYTLEDEETEWKGRDPLEKLYSGYGFSDLALGSPVVPESRESVSLNYTEYYQTTIDTTLTTNLYASIIMKVNLHTLDNNILFSLRTTGSVDAIKLEVSGTNLKLTAKPKDQAALTMTGTTDITAGKNYTFALVHDHDLAEVVLYINGTEEGFVDIISGTNGILEPIDGEMYVGGALDVGKSDFDISSFLLYETDESRVGGVITNTLLINNDDNIVELASSLGALALYRFDDNGV